MREEDGQDGKSKAERFAWLAPPSVVFVQVIICVCVLVFVCRQIMAPNNNRDHALLLFGPALVSYCAKQTGRLEMMPIVTAQLEHNRALPQQLAQSSVLLA